ncbi:MAG: hypothetical protein CL808_02260 [Citromicrobium sp.]|nr:hypothetical protein [Citromicrobium sp.]
MLRLFLATVLAAALVPSAAYARPDAEVNAKLLTMGKWSNEDSHVAKYEALLAAPDLTDAQRARVLNYRAASRGGAGDKLGQLADLDLLVQSYPGVPAAESYADARAYAYVQAWHLADRALKGLARLNGPDGGELRDLWELGYWDDVAAFALKNGAITISNTEQARDIARKLAASGRGTAQMCVAVMENKAPCEIGPQEPSPQPLTGEGLAAALRELQGRAAVYKTG